MKVIEYNEAASLALENTLASFGLARLLGVNIIKLGVHIAKVEHNTVINDSDLKQIGKLGVYKCIKDYALDHWLAHRSKLNICIYMVSSRFLGRLISFLYLKVAICSDHPEWLVKYLYPIARSIEKIK